MAYVNTRLSGIGQFDLMTRLRARAPLALPVLRQAVPVVERYPAIVPLRPTVPTVAPQVMPARPISVAPVVRTVAAKIAVPTVTLVKPAVVTAARIEPVKILRVAARGWFPSTGIAEKVYQALRAPSGATYKSTYVKVVPGTDPTARTFTGAGAPLTGQTVSLREPDPIVPVGASEQGLTFIGKPAAVPTEISPPVAKAGIPPIVWLIAIGIALPIFFKKKGKRR